MQCREYGMKHEPTPHPLEDGNQCINPSHTANELPQPQVLLALGF